MSHSALQFLLVCYFGSEGSLRDGFISRAYRDMNRTLRGISKLDKEEADALKRKAAGLLSVRMDLLANQTKNPDVDAARSTFDQWHKESCAALITLYNDCFDEKGIDLRMSHGQAQKWLNMLVKYCLVCGTPETWDIKDWYSVAHIPVDSLIMTAARRRGIPTPQAAWSKLGLEEYVDFQNAVRGFANDRKTTPLQLEHAWWLEQPSTADEE